MNSTNHAAKQQFSKKIATRLMLYIIYMTFMKMPTAFVRLVNNRSAPCSTYANNSVH